MECTCGAAECFDDPIEPPKSLSTLPLQPPADFKHAAHHVVNLQPVSSPHERPNERCIAVNAPLTMTCVGNGESGKRAWTFVNNANACLHTVRPPRGGTGDVWESFSSKTCRLDCSVDSFFSQRFKPRGRRLIRQFAAVARIAKSLMIAVTTSITMTLAVLTFVTFESNVCNGQLVDDLDSYPPRWQLNVDDSNAKVLSHKNKSDGGHDDGPYESITVLANDQDAILVYPIEPVRVLDDLTAILHVRSVNSGAKIGFRIRYPYLVDPFTRRTVTRVVDGTEYKDESRWQRIGIGVASRLVQNATVTVRGEYGRGADVRDAMIDAITIRVPAHPGESGQTFDLDRLSVDGMIAMASLESLPNAAPSEINSASRINASRTSLENSLDPSGEAPMGDPLDFSQRPFPVGITRMIEYRGEPLVWLRSLGFDAIWLDQTIDAAILSEAHRSRMRIYSPVPSVLDPTLTPLLQPLAGWIVRPSDSSEADDSSGGVLDSRYLDSVVAATKRLRELPSRWQRPIVAAPLENFGDYSRHLDAVVRHLPPRARGLSTVEEIEDHRRQIRDVPTDVQIVLGIDSQPPRRAVNQNRLLANSLGNQPPSTVAWQSLWCQTIRQIASAPDAILFRSSASLSLGDPTAAGRASALSYINRMIAMIEPSLVQSVVRGNQEFADVRVTGRTAFIAQRCTASNATWYFITSDETSTCHAAAGDGGTLTIPTGSGLAYRLTHFSAEMLPIRQQGNGRVVEIISPDACEIIVMTDDASIGGQLAASAATFRDQAAADRLALATTAMQQLASERQFVQMLSGATPGSFRTISPVIEQLQRDNNLVQVAGTTLSSTEAAASSRDMASVIRSASRADAWISRAQMSLHRSLVGESKSIISWPSLVADDPQTQWMMQTTMPGASLPSLDSDSTLPSQFESDVVQFGDNLLSSGSLDEPELMGRTDWGGERWSIGRRLTQTTNSEVSHTRGDTYAGGGAVRAVAWMKPLASITNSANNSAEQSAAMGIVDAGGGYGGTILQIQSPPVRFTNENQAVETVVIGAVIKTVGFSGPHQGLLVYDSIGGPELGVLIRRRPGWTPVQLVRHVPPGSSVSVQFELIGPGEAILDEVSIRRIEPIGARPVIRPLR